MGDGTEGSGAFLGFMPGFECSITIHDLICLEGKDEYHG